MGPRCARRECARGESPGRDPRPPCRPRAGTARRGEHQARDVRDNRSGRAVSHRPCRRTPTISTSAGANTASGNRCGEIRAERAHCAASTLHIAEVGVHRQHRAMRNARGRLLDADDARQAELAGDDGAVREHAAALDDEPGHQAEHRRPPRIGLARDEHVAGRAVRDACVDSRRGHGRRRRSRSRRRLWSRARLSARRRRVLACHGGRVRCVRRPSPGRDRVNAAPSGRENVSGGVRRLSTACCVPAESRPAQRRHVGTSPGQRTAPRSPAT